MLCIFFIQVTVINRRKSRLRVRPRKITSFRRPILMVVLRRPSLLEFVFRIKTCKFRPAVTALRVYRFEVRDHHL